MEKGTQLKCINIKPLQGNDIAPRLKLEETYTLVEEYTCKCEEKHYNVGVTSYVNSVTCYKCREELPHSDVIHWCHSSRFEVV